LYSICPVEWQQKSLLAAAGKVWPTLITPESKVEFVFPAVTGGQTAQLGQCRLQVSNLRSCVFAWASLGNFTNNCGVVSLSGLQTNQATCGMNPELEKLWLQTIETYVYLLGYSVIVGSDGSQTNRQVVGRIENFGDKGWVVKEVGYNRRVDPHHTHGYKLWLFHKYLEKPALPQMSLRYAQSASTS
jgi:hypothetical protein